MHSIANVKIKKLNPEAIIPSYAKEGDAGMDLVAITEEKSTVIKQGQYGKVQYIEYGTGLAVEIPKGFVGLIYPRSSISKYNLILANSVGVIDSGYRGEILVRFKSTMAEGCTPIHYNKGDKIAQLVVVPVPKVSFIECTELSDSDRGAGGFGSSGA